MTQQLEQLGNSIANMTSSLESLSETLVTLSRLASSDSMEKQTTTIKNISTLTKTILSLKDQRVIFNKETENEEEN